MAEEKADQRSLPASDSKQIPAPQLPYRPPAPRSYHPRIGLIGCGGITKSHLEAYRKMGWDVAALCDPRLSAAEERRGEFFPDAQVCSDYREVLTRTDIEVVDIATHPEVRAPIIRDALTAGKHVLSQKPFVNDLAVGRELVEFARRENLALAVNQNARWAPYFSYLRQAVKQGLLGDIQSVDIHVAWDHTWIQGTPFEKIHHVILYDFAIHWFDIVACLLGDRQPESVFAQVGRSTGQSIAPPLNAHVTLPYEGGMASLVFRADTRFDALETTVVTGDKGTFRTSGPVCENDQIALTTESGKANAVLEGKWFPDGFAGAMGELLSAIEEGREPENSASSNLRSLAICFAALASADSGRPVSPADALADPPFQQR